MSLQSGIRWFFQTSPAPASSPTPSHPLSLLLCSLDGGQMFPATAALQNVTERARGFLPLGWKQRRGRAGAVARLQAGGRRQSPARPRVPTHRAPGAAPIPGHRAWARAGAKCRPRPGKEQGAKTRLWAEADPGALPAPCLHGARGPSCPAASPRAGIRAGRTWTSSPEHRRTGPWGGRWGLAGEPASVPDGGRGRKAWEQQPGRIQRWGLRHVWGNWHTGAPGGKVGPP